MAGKKITLDVYEGATLDCAAGRKHVKALVKAVRENDLLSRGMRRESARKAGKGNWSFWLGKTCPNVPRDEYAGEGGRVKRMALLAAAGDENSSKALSMREAREAGEDAPKRKTRKAKASTKQVTISIG